MASSIWPCGVHQTTETIWPAFGQWLRCWHKYFEAQLRHMYWRETNCKTFRSVINVHERSQTTYPHWSMREIWYDLPPWSTILYPLCWQPLVLHDRWVPESKESGSSTCQSILNLPQKSRENTPHDPHRPRQRVYKWRPEKLVLWARNRDQSNSLLLTFSEQCCWADELHPHQTRVDYACSHKSS